MQQKSKGWTAATGFISRGTRSAYRFSHRMRHWREARLILWAGLTLGAAGWSPHAVAGMLGLSAGTNCVGRYEKVEFTITGAPHYANPFDPGEVDITLQITTPEGSQMSLPAFYRQNYERQRRPLGGGEAEWLYPIGEPEWKARFAPAATGIYSCKAALKDYRGSAVSSPVEFRCVPSSQKGYIGISPRDPRFLEWSDGTPFFAIGQNVAFVKDTFYVQEIFRRLAAHGANFARVWTCCEDWGLALEARKSAWGRSWDWHPSIVPMPGRDAYLSDERCLRLSGEDRAAFAVSPSRPVGLRPGTRYVISGLARAENELALTIEANGQQLETTVPGNRQWTRFQREWTTGTHDWWLGTCNLRLPKKGTLWLRELSLKEAAGGAELLWEADVNRPVLGQYNLADAFLLDCVLETAETNGLYLQLCLLTRDLYMDRLRNDSSPAYDQAIANAQRLLRYAVARWGYSTHVASWEYFNENNPGLPNARFYAELAQALDHVDIYHHLRTSSAWSASPREWQNPSLDLANLHYYMRPADGPLFKDEVLAVLDRARFLRRQTPTSRPSLFAEFGLAKDDWQPTPYLRQDINCVHLHNALWASALSGLAGTVHSWWWEDLHQLNAYRHYQGVAAFMSDIPLATGALHEISAQTAENRYRVAGLQSDKQAYLWLSDSEATWWKQVVEKQPQETRPATFSIAGLKAARYEVQWWDTLKGVPVGTEILTQNGPALELQTPPFCGDIAAKIRLLDPKTTP
jgi:hypothetical protein